MTRALWQSEGGGQFFMSEVPLWGGRLQFFMSEVTLWEGPPVWGGQGVMPCRRCWWVASEHHKFISPHNVLNSRARTASKAGLSYARPDMAQAVSWCRCMLLPEACTCSDAHLRVYRGHWNMRSTTP